MTNHLPECPTDWCICLYLRACEARVREGWYEVQSGTWEQGFRYALDAAREAVDFVTVFIADVGEKGKPDLRQMIHVGSAIAAIDELREDRQTPPPLPPSVGVPERRWT